MAQLLFLSGRAWCDANGNPYPAATADFFVPGTTTGQDSYTSASLATPHSNPVVSDASTGIFPNIYLAAKRYKVRIRDASANTLETWEVVDATSQLISSASAPSPTYPFLRYHNTSDGLVYRRNAADNAWISEGAVDSLLNAASVTEQLTGTATDKSSTPDSVAALWNRGADLTPSAGTVSLPAGGGKHFNLAGGAISALSSAQGGREVWLMCTSTNALTHNATSFELDSAANVTTAISDILVCVNKAATDASGSNWRVHIIRKSGSPLTVTDVIASQAQMETATANTVAVTPGRLQNHPGVCKGWVNFTVGAATTASHNVTSITDTGTAKWAIVWATDFSSANYCCVTGSEATANNETAVDTLSAGGVNVKMYRSDDTNTAETNSTASHVAAFGDQ